MAPIKNLSGDDRVDKSDPQSAAEAGPTPAMLAARHAAAARLRTST